MKCRYFFILYCGLLLSVNLQAATNKDSLWTEWNKTELIDSIRLETFLTLFEEHYLYDDLDSALTITDLLEKEGINKNNIEWQAEAKKLQAVCHHFNQDYDKAAVLYQEAANFFQRIKDEDGYRTVIDNLSLLYQNTGKYDKALEVAKTNYEYRKKLPPSKLLVNTILGMGNNYFYLGNMSAALDAYLEGLSITEENHWESESSNFLQPIANIYFNLDQLAIAEKYLNRSISFSLSSGDYYGISYDYSLLAEIYEKRNKFQKAKNTYAKALEYTEYNYNKGGVLEILNGLSTLYLEKSDSISVALDYAQQLEVEAIEQKNEEYLSISYSLQGACLLKINLPKKAILICEKANELTSGNLNNQQKALECLYDAHKKIKQYQKALGVLEKLIDVNDSLFNEASVRKITQSEMQYEYNKEKLQDSLRNQVQLALLEKDKEVLVAKNKNYLLGIGSIGVLSLLGLFSFWNTRRKNKIILSQNHELERLNTTKDQLFTIISHDLRKPALAFRGISKKVRFLLEQKEFDTLDKYGSALEKSANSLNALLDNLLKWALQQRNTLPYQPISINVAEVTEEIMDLFEQMAAEKNISLKVDIPESTTVFVDQNTYQTIIRNLIDNAIKFTPEGGMIELKASEQNKGVLLKIKDSGVGIAKEKLAKIFDLQKQKSTRGTAGEPGTGLGLSLVKDLVRLNKGSISVQSKWQEGTTFELAFPMV